MLLPLPLLLPLGVCGGRVGPVPMGVVYVLLLLEVVVVVLVLGGGGGV